jgi:uncharacterized membrane protein YjgN (DUF898 family)
LNGFISHQIKSNQIKAISTIQQQVFFSFSDSDGSMILSFLLDQDTGVQYIDLIVTIKLLSNTLYGKNILYRFFVSVSYHITSYHSKIEINLKDDEEQPQ